MSTLVVELVGRVSLGRAVAAAARPTGKCRAQRRCGRSPRAGAEVLTSAGVDSYSFQTNLSSAGKREEPRDTRQAPISYARAVCPVCMCSSTSPNGATYLVGAAVAGSLRSSSGAGHGVDEVAGVAVGAAGGAGDVGFAVPRSSRSVN